MQQQKEGLAKGYMLLPRPRVIPPPNIPPAACGGSRQGASISSRTSTSLKVARILPSRPLRTLRPGLSATSNATRNFHSLSRATHSVSSSSTHHSGQQQQATMQHVKREPFDVFSLDSD